jgi:hypothetical protein
MYTATKTDRAIIRLIDSAEPNGWFWAEMNWSPMTFPTNS